VAFVVRALPVVVEALERGVAGFRPVEILNDGVRAGFAFRHFEDPNVYQLWASTWAGDTAHGPNPDTSQAREWWINETITDLQEELDTGFLARAVKVRTPDGEALMIDYDAPAADPLDDDYYLSAVLDYADHLRQARLNVGPGQAARAGHSDVGWIAAYVNSRTGNPPVGQVVIVNGPYESTGLIAHLELIDGCPDRVGHELSFDAIMMSARHGHQRLYADASLTLLAPFDFTIDAADPRRVYYDITDRDLTWPMGERR
jgi:hypothetical protein